MKNVLYILLAMLTVTVMAGCSDSGDHAHPHDDGATSAVHDHGDGEHSHDGDSEHSHDEPQTEAFYGEPSEAEGAADDPMPSDHEHQHDGTEQPHDDHDDHEHDHQNDHGHEHGADEHSH